MKNRMFLLAVFLPLVLFANAAETLERIPVQVQSCKFSVAVPEKWDTIPQSALDQKLGKGVAVLGLYPKDQVDPFRERYIILSFMPTVKGLNSLSYDAIFENLKEMNEKNHMPDTDSLRVVYNGMERFSNDGKFWICTSITVYKDSVNVNCLQNLLLSKFGYINVTYYDKSYITPDYEDVVQKMTQNIDVDDDYLYVEPQKESAFTPGKIAIALGVGILVYLMMVLLDKRKKK